MADMNDILIFWDLNENPFSDSVRDTRFFFQSRQHRQAINVVVTGFKDINLDIAALTGYVGTGKSFTCRVIATLLNTKFGFYTIFVPESFSTYEELVCYIAQRITGEECERAVKANAIIHKLLTEAFKRGQQVLFALDECQGYDTKVLDRIRQMVNKNAEFQGKVLSLLLVGQTELSTTIANMQQLDSRIKIRHSFNNLDRDEVLKYIAFRMWRASKDPELNAKADILAEADNDLPELKASPFYAYRDDIYKATGGMPRSINYLCSNILTQAAEKGEKSISWKIVQSVITDFEQRNSI